MTSPADTKDLSGGRVVHLGAGSPWSQVTARTVIDVVVEAARTLPEVPAMVFEDGLVVTREELLQSAERFAGYLATRVDPGDRVAVMLGNRAEFMIAWLGALGVRATLVAINPGAKSHDAGHILKDSGAVLLVAGVEQRDLVADVRGDCPNLQDVIWVEDLEPNGLQATIRDVEPFPLVSSEVQRGDIANLYYTSGTTGPPKGCMIDHEYLLRAVDVDLRLHPKSADDRILCCLQFFYLDPALLLLIALQCGGTLVVMRSFSVTRFWDVVRTNSVTEILAIASIPVFLLKAPPGPMDRDHKVKRALQVAVPPSLHREMNDRWGFPWIDGYGSTEGGFIARVPLANADEMVGSGSMGIPCPEVQTRIVSDAGDDLPVGKVGEILVKAPGMMRGYLNQPAATAAALKDGWLHTGDLARSDDRGFLYFMGRTKDIIRRSGENLSAAEVEDVLRSHPRIMEAAVVPVPDGERGEEVKAYIELVEGATPRDLPPEEILLYCAARLARFKVPRYIEYRTTGFPLTASMRVAKDRLKQERSNLVEGCWDAPTGLCGLAEMARDRDVFLAGVAETPLGEVHDQTELSMAALASMEALDEAGLTFADVDGLFVNYMGEEGTVQVGEYLGIQPRYADSTDFGGAAFEAFIHRSIAAIREKQFEVGLIAYGSRQRSRRNRSMIRNIDPQSIAGQFEVPLGLPTPIGQYAMIAARHMHQFGTTSSQLAEIAVAASRWAELNPKAWRRKALTVDEVLSSQMISDPLHKLDCCLVTDGGGALVVTTAERARDARKKAIRILAAAERQSHWHISQMPDLTVSVGKESAAEAFGMAGITAQDVDVLQPYDAFTITVLMILEDLGFCPKGEGGAFVENGRLGPGGSLPAMTSGGGLSYNHPGALGLQLIVEAVRQLRGEAGDRQVPNARLAVAHGIGGMLSTASTVVLARD